MTNSYLYQYSYMEIKVIYEVKMNYLRKEHISSMADNLYWWNFIFEHLSLKKNITHFFVNKNVAISFLKSYAAKQISSTRK